MEAGVSGMEGAEANRKDMGEVLKVPVPKPRPAHVPSAQADALSALGNLGYVPGEAAAAVAELGAEMDGADAAALIRAALKKLAPKS